jgi:hypothetical protein
MMADITIESNLKERMECVCIGCGGDVGDLNGKNLPPWKCKYRALIIDENISQM